MGATRSYLPAATGLMGKEDLPISIKSHPYFTPRTPLPRPPSFGVDLFFLQMLLRCDGDVVQHGEWVMVVRGYP